ncbi:hypothetical protein JCM8202_006353 [Rhodotorula sphaerocarpa]
MDASAATLLSVLHVTVGASSLLAPSWTASLFGLVPSPSARFVTRLFGSRDLALGLAILSTKRTSSLNSAGANANTAGRIRSRAGAALSDSARGALLAANWINGLDVVSSLVCWLQGDIGETAFLLGGPGAAFLLALGVWSLR